MGHIGKIGPHGFEELLTGTVVAFFDFFKMGLDSGEEWHRL